MANQDHLDKLRQGSIAWNQWLAQNPDKDIRPDLSYADLSGEDLNHFNLTHTDLRKANLTDTNLSNTFLHCTNFSSATLTRTNFSSAAFRCTILDNVDLQTAKGLETAHHLAPSSIRNNTVGLSQGNIPKEFLEKIKDDYYDDECKYC